MNTTEIQRMKILVIDDNANHRRAAEVLLGKDHDLTVVDSFIAGKKALYVGVDYDILERLIQEEELGVYPREQGKVAIQAYESKRDELERRATVRPMFDVVLCDLMMPAPSETMGGEGLNHVGKEMPLGLVLAFKALKEGIKYIAVVTDINHHHHPASAALDMLNSPADMGGARVLLTNYPNLMDFDGATFELLSREYLDSAEGKVKYPHLNGEWGPRRGVADGKGWNQILQQLLEEKKESSVI